MIIHLLTLCCALAKVSEWLPDIDLGSYGDAVNKLLGKKEDKTDRVTFSPETSELKPSNLFSNSEREARHREWAKQYEKPLA